MAELLKLIYMYGPSFSLTLNLKKREVLWPSGDPSFLDLELPSKIYCPLQTSAYEWFYNSLDNDIEAAVPLECPSTEVIDIVSFEPYQRVQW